MTSDINDVVLNSFLDKTSKFSSPDRRARRQARRASITDTLLPALLENTAESAIDNESPYFRSLSKSIYAESDVDSVLSLDSISRFSDQSRFDSVNAILEQANSALNDLNSSIFKTHQTLNLKRVKSVLERVLKETAIEQKKWGFTTWKDNAFDDCTTCLSELDSCTLSSHGSYSPPLFNSSKINTQTNFIPEEATNITMRSPDRVSAVDDINESTTNKTASKPHSIDIHQYTAPLEIIHVEDTMRSSDNNAQIDDDETVEREMGGWKYPNRIYFSLFAVKFSIQLTIVSILLKF